MRIAFSALVALAGCFAPQSERLAHRKELREDTREAIAARLNVLDRVRTAKAMQQATTDDRHAEPGDDSKPDTTFDRKGAEIIPVPRVQCVIDSADGDWCAGCKKLKADEKEYRTAGWSVGPEPWNQIRFRSVKEIPVKDRPLSWPRISIVVDGEVKERFAGYRTPKELSDKINAYRLKYSDAK